MCHFIRHWLWTKFFLSFCLLSLTYVNGIIHNSWHHIHTRYIFTLYEIEFSLLNSKYGFPKPFSSPYPAIYYYYYYCRWEQLKLDWNVWSIAQIESFIIFRNDIWCWRDSFHNDNFAFVCFSGDWSGKVRAKERKEHRLRGAVDRDIIPSWQIYGKPANIYIILNLLYGWYGKYRQQYLHNGPPRVLFHVFYENGILV